MIKTMGNWALLVGLLAAFGCTRNERPPGNTSPRSDGASSLADVSSPADGASRLGAEGAKMGNSVRVIFLHHSTGQNIWDGGVSSWIGQYNQSNGTSYRFDERSYPAGGAFESAHGWSNYPFDYWNLWVNHAGSQPYLGQDTLEVLTGQYNVIVWKHCFPVSNIGRGGAGDVSSPDKTLANYQLQYEALKQKMRSFPNHRFVVWTGAAQVQQNVSAAEAEQARTFFTWVKETWDEPGDNIFVWDFWQLETEGGLYLLNQYASSPSDSHPNGDFAARVAPLFGQRLVNVIEGRGDTTSLTGQ
jgi:hypothetical protein